MVFKITVIIMIIIITMIIMIIMLFMVMVLVIISIIGSCNCNCLLSQMLVTGCISFCKLFWLRISHSSKLSFNETENDPTHYFPVRFHRTEALHKNGVEYHQQFNGDIRTVAYDDALRRARSLKNTNALTDYLTSVCLLLNYTQPIMIKMYSKVRTSIRRNIINTTNLWDTRYLLKVPAAQYLHSLFVD